MHTNLFVLTGSTTGYNIFTSTLISGLKRVLAKQNKSFRDEFNLIPVSESRTKDAFLKEDLNLNSIKKMGDVSVSIAPFTAMPFFSGKTRVGFPMYEGSILSQANKEILGDLDYILSPCEHLQDLYESELSTPSLKVLAGIDTHVFQNYSNRILKRNQAEPYTEKNPCVFLVVGKYEKRKASIEVLEAFLKYFEDHPMRDKVVLKAKWLAKCYSRSLNQIRQETKRLMLEYPKAAKRVVIIDNPNVSIVKEYNESDCVIMASKAEGIGLPLLEAMACGVPVITSTHTSLKDYSHPDLNILINSDSKEPMNDEFYGIQAKSWGEMGTVRVEDIIAALDTFMNMKHEERINRSELARNFVVNNFSSEAMAERFLEALNVIRSKSKGTGDASCGAVSCS